MAHENQDDGLIRRYLLGRLGEDEREQLEEKMLADNEVFNRVLLAEDEMVEDYVNGELPESDRAEFEASFLSTPEGRKQVTYARALSEYVKDASPSRDAEVRVGENPIEREPLTELQRKFLPTQVAEAPFRGSGVKPVWWRRPALVPYLAGAAAAVIVIGLGLGISRIISPSEVSKGLTALAYAYRDQRPLEARISGFGYASASTTRGDEPNVDWTARKLAENVLLEAVLNHPNAATHHAAGRLYLAEKKFEDAIKEFDEALKTDPNNAQLHSDYGAALFEYSLDLRSNDESGASVEALARSLEHLNHALALDPKLHEALFNRALLHERMMLVERAIEDWRAYIEHDASGPWADEARQHLSILEESQRRNAQSQRSVVEDFMTAFRGRDSERAWSLFSANREKLITELLAGYLSNPDPLLSNSASELLDALDYAGGLDAQRVGDFYTVDTARFYKIASQQTKTVAREAIEITGKARESYLGGEVETAKTLRERARDIFFRIGDQSDARLATYWLALHLWELGLTQESESLLEPLLGACQADHYHWLRARALYQRATIAFKLDEHSNAISYYQQSQALADSINDPQSELDARDGLIEKYRLLGAREQCLAKVAESLARLKAPSLGPMPLWRHFNFLATAFAVFGFPDAAIDHARESLRFALEVGNFTMLSFCYAHLGLTYGRAQLFEDAFSNVQRAYDVAAAHETSSLGQLMMAYASVQTGHLYRERGDFAQALDAYDRAIELHRLHALDFSTHLYQAFKGRLACYMALNDTSAAHEQLTTLIALMDKHRAQITEEENRDNFFDIEQSVYDMGIDLAYSRMQDADQAFLYAEASRGRSLLVSMQGSKQVAKGDDLANSQLVATARPLDLIDIQKRIPDRTRILEYAVLDDKLIIWVISRDDLKSVPIPLSEQMLGDIVDRFMSAVEETSGARAVETQQLGRALFDYLIAPVEAMLKEADTLIVVPDKELSRLPWDALFTPRDKPLLEEYLVMTNPSATLFAVCTDLAAQKDDGREERILSVGNPSFDRQAFPELQPLTSAKNEAETIHKLYSRTSCLLFEGAASEKAVREQLPSADVAQFALHCVSNKQSGMRPSLVLAQGHGGRAPTSDNDGVLQAQEIGRLQMPRLRLAVLSACQTGAGRYYRGEGMISLARSFLAARVPLVVASLWSVNSEATADLMIRFHQYRKRYGNTARALRDAKLDLLRANTTYSRPVYWAGFQLVGGQASF
jgi:CHAT domain-containing protein